MELKLRRVARNGLDMSVLDVGQVEIRNFFSKASCHRTIRETSFVKKLEPLSVVRVFGQSRGQNTSCRAATDNDVICRPDIHDFSARSRMPRRETRSEALFLVQT